MISYFLRLEDRGQTLRLFATQKQAQEAVPGARAFPYNLGWLAKDAHGQWLDYAGALNDWAPCLATLEVARHRTALKESLGRKALYDFECNSVYCVTGRGPVSHTHDRGLLTRIHAHQAGRQREPGLQLAMLCLFKASALVVLKSVIVLDHSAKKIWELPTACLPTICANAQAADPDVDVVRSRVGHHA